MLKMHSSQSTPSLCESCCTRLCTALVRSAFLSGTIRTTGLVPTRDEISALLTARDPVPSAYGISKLYVQRFWMPCNRFQATVIQPKNPVYWLYRLEARIWITLTYQHVYVESCAEMARLTRLLVYVRPSQSCAMKCCNLPFTYKLKRVCCLSI